MGWKSRQPNSSQRLVPLGIMGAELWTPNIREKYATERFKRSPKSHPHYISTRKSKKKKLRLGFGRNFPPVTLGLALTPKPPWVNITYPKRAVYTYTYLFVYIHIRICFVRTCYLMFILEPSPRLKILPNNIFYMTFFPTVYMNIYMLICFIW